MSNLTLLRSLVFTLLTLTWVAAQESPLVVRIPEDDAKKLVVSKVSADYPAMAKNMHLAGKVVVDVLIDEEGKVEKAQPANGNPLLSGAAVTAVKKWKFSPFTANGHAHKVVTSVAFDFKL